MPYPEVALENAPERGLYENRWKILFGEPPELLSIITLNGIEIGLGEDKRRSLLLRKTNRLLK
jgi:hypothetical protein